jgi:hypothetical protein
MRHILTACLATAIGLATPIAAQRLAPAFATHSTPVLLATSVVPAAPTGVPDTNADAIRLVMGGLGLGVVGVFLGGYAGARIEENGGCAGDEFCGLAGALVGATVGETLLLPAGVHIANHQRGSYALDLGAAGLVALGGWLLTVATNDGVALLAIPVGQLVTAVLIERHSGARSRGP